MGDIRNPNEYCRVLLIEDDSRLAGLVQEYLQQNNMLVTVEQRGDRAVMRILEEEPDLVVLDLMLPGKDGLEICREVRPRFHNPILMLTARDEDVDQIVGLEIGADDYVTKPVQPRVLLAHIRALLRRMGVAGYPEHFRQHDLQNVLEFGQLRISRACREVSLNGETLDFTTNEFELLWLLASRAGEVLSRDVICETLRGIGYDGLDRSVDLRVSRLRKKLGDSCSNPTLIKTVRGKGYLFAGGALSR